MDVLHLSEQRSALLAFAAAIGARRKLGSDEAGNPRIEGRQGRIYVQPSTCAPGKTPKYQIYVYGGEQRWRFAREALNFAKLTNNGLDEGILLLDRLPLAHEGEIIRTKLDIGKKRVLSENSLAKLRAFAFQARVENDLTNQAH